MAQSLEGKVVFITGASSGIGEGIARLFAKNGARITIAARRKDRLETLKSDILKTSPKAEILTQELDVTDGNAFNARVQEAIKHFGHVDILINNAGVMHLSHQRNLKIEEWHRMIDVNIKGVLNGVAAVLTHMRDRNSGHIVNYSSDADRKVFPGSAVYSGTKAFVTMYSLGLRDELAREKKEVRVSTISSGAVESELGMHITDNTLPPFVPFRFNTPEEIADVVHFVVTAPKHVNIHNILLRPLEQDG